MTLRAWKPSALTGTTIGSILCVGVLTASFARAAEKPADLKVGEKVYLLKCMTCHGRNGKGDGPTAQSLDKKPRNFTEPGFLDTRSDADLKKTILEGRPPMPPFKAALKDKDIESVIPYVKALAKSGGGTPQAGSR